MASSVDAVAKCVPFWGDLLPPKLATLKHSDFLLTVLDKSKCNLCSCQQFTHPMFTLDTVQNTLKSIQDDALDETTILCFECGHSEHLDSTLFDFNILVENTVIEHDREILQYFHVHESRQEYRELYLQLGERFDAMLTTIPNVEKCITLNSAPFEVPTIEYIMYSLPRRYLLEQGPDCPSAKLNTLRLIGAVRTFLSYLDTHFTLPSRAHFFDEKDASFYDEFEKLYNLHCELPRKLKLLDSLKLSQLFGLRFLRLFHGHIRKNFKLFRVTSKLCREEIQCFHFSLLDKLIDDLVALRPPKTCSSKWRISDEPNQQFLDNHNVKVINQMKMFQNDLTFMNSLGPSSAQLFPDYDQYHIRSDILSEISRKRKHSDPIDEAFEMDANFPYRIEHLELKECENEPKDEKSARKYYLGMQLQILIMNHLPNMATVVKHKIVVPNQSILLIDKQQVIGAITYRFGDDYCELLFLVINARNQTRGYGSLLMDMLKEACFRASVFTIYAYGDNNAVPFFTHHQFNKPDTNKKTPNDLFECRGAKLLCFEMTPTWRLSNVRAIQLLRIQCRDSMLSELMPKKKARKTTAMEPKIKNFWRALKEHPAYDSLLKLKVKVKMIEKLEFTLQFSKLVEIIEKDYYKSDVGMFTFDVRRMLSFYDYCVSNRKIRNMLDDFLLVCDFSEAFDKEFEIFFTTHPNSFALF